MYKITEKVALNPTVTKMVIEAPLIAKVEVASSSLVGRTFHLFVPGFRPATLVIIPHTPSVVNHKFTFFQKRMSFCSDTFFFILRAARTLPFPPCFAPLCARAKYSCFLFYKLL